MSCINELNSLKLQRESWLDKENSNPHWSFIEFMCCYFEDLGIDNNYEIQLKKNWISKNEYKTINNWHKLLDKYKTPKNDDYNHNSIIEDEDWQLIIRKGQETINELNKGLNKMEVQILIKEIDYKKLN